MNTGQSTVISILTENYLDAAHKAAKYEVTLRRIYRIIRAATVGDEHVTPVRPRTIMEEIEWALPNITEKERA